jgi:ABC-type lipoprotein release transport system permease subunit
MKLAMKLAYRNLIGAGLRTWLAVLVLSFSYVIIIWLKSVMMGWDYQAKTDMTNWEIGEGQYWHQAYDPYDPMSLYEASASFPDELNAMLENKDAMAVLMVPGQIYPQGRMLSVVLKGIDPLQSVLKLPSALLDTVVDEIPVIVGGLMAKSARLHAGDVFTLRWRDANGMFDATDVRIVGVFSSNVPAVEQGQIYLPLQLLQQMMLLENNVTTITLRNNPEQWTEVQGWEIKTKAMLTKQVDEMIKTKSAGQSVLYAVLLMLAMLAIFDTQVLSIFRRQKEIGTYVALGYTRQQVVGLFTVEGTMHAVLAAVLAMAYGLPFLLWQAKVGWTMPIDTSDFGMAIAQTLYPVFSAGLVLSTILFVMLTTAIVSWLPSRKIAKMNPTEALRGKLQ